jgi:hypothetical protein
MTTGLVLVLNVRPEPKHTSALLTERFGEGSVHSLERAAPLTQILRRSRVVVALLEAVASFAVMVSAMSLVGYVLVGHGAHQGAIFPVVSAHFIGMFRLVLVVSNHIDRLGLLRAPLGDCCSSASPLSWWCGRSRACLRRQQRSSESDRTGTSPTSPQQLSWPIRLCRSSGERYSASPTYAQRFWRDFGFSRGPYPGNSWTRRLTTPQRTPDLF